ncbi:unnamed protein product, partial [Iphiclides podalirius]
MDYVVGSVAALVTGNVTPNRPKFMKRALTPIKHQPSPNVTPKSEVVEDRSIFLSPTLQKKKAIVKKSPKRIFENPDLDASNDAEGNPNTKSPKADKVKKHLKEELEGDTASNFKSSKNKKTKVKEPALQNDSWKVEDETINLDNSQDQNESTPKKKKRQKTVVANDDRIAETEDTTDNNTKIQRKKKNKMLQNSSEKIVKNHLNEHSNDDHDNESKSCDNNKENDKSNEQILSVISPKKKYKQKALHQDTVVEEGNINKEIEDSADSGIIQNQMENRKKRNKLKSKTNEVVDTKIIANQEDKESNKDNNEKKSKKKKKGKQEVFINPNAVTDKDTDSEHESDNEIESENDQNNEEVLDTGPIEESSDEEEKVPEKKENENVTNNKEAFIQTEEQIKRTLFVGNVPFSVKCKKEIKKIFSKYGQIETVRIRTVPVKDARVTPKLAVIKNELHPDRSTVNVYVKFRDVSSVKEALAENGTVLNDHHLRVTRSDCTGSEHDPKSSVFVGNLPFALEDEALYKLFQKCGEIESVRIIRDKKTNAGKGFGYVNFKSKDAVELALALPEEDLTMKNRIIRVKRCTQITLKQKPQQDSRRGNFQGSPGRGNLQRDNARGGMQGNFRRGGGHGSYGRENAQRGSGRGRVQGSYGRGNAQRNFGRGHSHSNYGDNGQKKFSGEVGQGQGQFENRQSKPNDSKADGAMRRLMNKRRNQDDAGEGPQNKRQRNINQPGKKTRKEFVGMTAEKKKKHKVSKGQKKKKALSEVLTKQ